MVMPNGQFDSDAFFSGPVACMYEMGVSPILLLAVAVHDCSCLFILSALAGSVCPTCRT
jgi:hypothetical protein